MSAPICTILMPVVVITAIEAFVSNKAPAETINIILANVDVTYLGSVAGGTIYDAVAFSGGTLDQVFSSPVSFVVFELDNIELGSFSSSAGNRLYADLRISGIGTTVTKDVFFPAVGSNGGAFGLDFFTDSGQLLRTSTDQISLHQSSRQLRNPLGPLCRRPLSKLENRFRSWSRFGHNLRAHRQMPGRPHR